MGCTFGKPRPDGADGAPHHVGKEPTTAEPSTAQGAARAARPASTLIAATPPPGFHGAASGAVHRDVAAAVPGTPASPARTGWCHHRDVGNADHRERRGTVWSPPLTPSVPLQYQPRESQQNHNDGPKGHVRLSDLSEHSDTCLAPATASGPAAGCAAAELDSKTSEPPVGQRARRHTQWLDPRGLIQVPTPMTVEGGAVGEVQSRLATAILHGNIDNVMRCTADNADVNPVVPPTAAPGPNSVADRGSREPVQCLSSATCSQDHPSKSGSEHPSGAAPLYCATANGRADLTSVLRTAGATAGSATVISAAQTGGRAVAAGVLQVTDAAPDPPQPTPRKVVVVKLPDPEQQANESADGGKNAAELDGTDDVTDGLRLIPVMPDLGVAGSVDGVNEALDWLPRDVQVALLCNAARDGHLDTARQLLACDGTLTTAATGSGATALLVATLAGQGDTAQLLLDAGSDVNHPLPDGGGTALSAAVQEGHADIAAMLIAAGGSVNARAADGATPLYVAAAGGSKELVTMLLASGADVDARHSSTATPLVIAAHEGHIAVTRQLLKANADANHRTDTGATPLHAAVGCAGATRHGNRDEIVRLLVASGVDVDAARYDTGITALCSAAENGANVEAQVLIEAGAAVDYAPRCGASPLHLAAQEGHLATVNVLVGGGAEVNRQSSDGRGLTPLHAACLSGHAEIARALVEASADVNLKSAFGDTPLHAAAVGGSAQIAALLIEAGASASHTSNEGESPLALATACGSTMVEPILRAAATRR
mmetsp:Transcript_17550/g.45878  ORF Transcript_17550/g.45878 Transcript_17550/m.45878 type:complete len:773 (-) Transcript_17550:138-2456(-)